MAQDLRFPRRRRPGVFKPTLPSLSITFPYVSTWAFALCAFSLVIGAAFGALRAASGGAEITYGAVSGFPSFIECVVKYALPLIAIGVFSVASFISPLAAVVLAVRGSSVGYAAGAFLIGGGAYGAAQGFAVMSVQNVLITPAYLLCGCLALQSFSLAPRPSAAKGGRRASKVLLVLFSAFCVAAASLFESFCSPALAAAILSG